jgi:hypothetical protein
VILPVYQVEVVKFKEKSESDGKGHLDVKLTPPVAEK